MDSKDVASLNSFLDDARRHTTRQKHRWEIFFKKIELRSMQADEEDSFSIKENFYELFSDRVPNSSLTNDSMDHVHYIEKVLKSNLRLFREFKKESKRLLKHVSTEDIYSYLSSCTVIDEKIPNEIEKSFGVIFKNRLLSTRSEISENRFDLTSLLHQWDEISKRFTEDHVIQYYIYVKKCEF